MSDTVAALAVTAVGNGISLAQPTIEADATIAAVVTDAITFVIFIVFVLL